MNVKLKLVSSLEKVFLDQEPEERPELGIPQGFQNEVISFQAAFTMIDPPVRDYIHVEVDSPIAPQVHVRKVVHVPVRLAAYENCGDNYLRTTPGLYPDLLTEIGEHSLRAYPGQWDSLWVDVKPEGKVAGGVYPVTLRLTNDAGETVAERTQMVEVLPGLLPEQKLIHTKWLHCDCLAQYYHVPVFSEEHWRILENFIKKAVEGGINMILTPVHTPPLDTRRGGERLTTQLVGVTLENGEYRFDMANLRRWIAMCKRCGVKYYEVAHLYSQWGATAAPKIMATVDGEYRRLFGWETTATGEDYRRFLNAYVPALLQVFREEGVDRQTYWHVSDEPSLAQLDDYRAARDQVAGLLEGYCIMDALSNLDFYKTGAVDHPIPANNHIDPFLEAGVPGLWTYYCCSQHQDVSNMFMSMPSARNRILGVQLFKFDIEGFLQWGFNFYNAQYSDYPIDPYANTDGDGFVPAGDTFQVYPGADGQPEESIRMAVTTQAMQDLRAFEWLGELVGRDAVKAMIDEGLAEPVTFSRFPRSQDYLINLRRRVNRAILDAAK